MLSVLSALIQPSNALSVLSALIPPSTVLSVLSALIPLSTALSVLSALIPLSTALSVLSALIPLSTTLSLATPQPPTASDEPPFRQTAQCVSLCPSRSSRSCTLGMATGPDLTGSDTSGQLEAQARGLAGTAVISNSTAVICNSPVVTSSSTAVIGNSTAVVGNSTAVIGNSTAVHSSRQDRRLKERKQGSRQDQRLNEGKQGSRQDRRLKERKQGAGKAWLPEAGLQVRLQLGLKVLVFVLQCPETANILASSLHHHQHRHSIVINIVTPYLSTWSLHSH